MVSHVTDTNEYKQRPDDKAQEIQFYQARYLLFSPYYCQQTSTWFPRHSNMPFYLCQLTSSRYKFRRSSLQLLSYLRYPKYPGQDTTCLSKISTSSHTTLCPPPLVPSPQHHHISPPPRPPPLPPWPPLAPTTRASSSATSPSHI